MIKMVGLILSPEDKLWVELIKMDLRERPRSVVQLLEELKEGGFPERIITEVLQGDQKIGVGTLVFKKSELSEILLQHFLENVSRLPSHKREEYVNGILKDLERWQREALGPDPPGDT